MLTELVRKTRRISVCAFLAVVPLGVELPEERDGEATFGVHGGGGRVITVLRDCDGNAIDSSSTSFTEMSASVEYARRLNETGRTVLGLRGGRIWGDRKLPTYPEEVRLDSGNAEFTYNYINPHLAFEWRSVGLGVGYLSGDVPVSFDDGDQADFSFHVRLGRLDRVYFKVSGNEAQPFLTGGGPYVLGLGYGPSPRFGGFTGFSVGFYDGLGLGQTFVIGLKEDTALDLGLRVATTEGKFDGGVSAGLRFSFSAD